MRVLKLTLGDARLQMKCGFYGVYAIFTAVYILALLAIPCPARKTVATVMILTDPAAMGLFFMGALVLLERDQHINSALAASPVRTWEYCLAKLLSLSLIALAVALPLAFFGGVRVGPGFVAGLLLASLLFSVCGLMAAELARSLNQFVLLAVPFELLIFLPPALLLFGIDRPFLTLHPAVAAVRLICGDAESPALCLLCLALWCAPVLSLCVRTVSRRFLNAGGGAL